MSTAADLILATPDDVQAIVESDYPLGKFKGVSVDGVDPLKLAALHWALTQKTLKEILPEYHPVGEASPQGPWLVRLPGELIAAIGKIAPTDQPGVAAKFPQLLKRRRQAGPSRTRKTILAAFCRLPERLPLKERPSSSGSTTRHGAGGRCPDVVPQRTRPFAPATGHGIPHVDSGTSGPGKYIPRQIRGIFDGMNEPGKGIQDERSP